MKLTTKGRYAVTAMLDIAVHQNTQSVVRLAEISDRQKLSQSYLEQLLNKLRRRGLVSSLRGSQGGYVLARIPAEISVADIILAIDEPIDATRCAGAANCHKGEQCTTHHLWMELNKVMLNFLNDVNLDTLMQRQKTKS